MAYGGVVSGPVFREVADKLYAYKIEREPVKKFVASNDSALYKINGTRTDLNNIFSYLKYNESTPAGNALWNYSFIKNGSAQVYADDSLSIKNKVPNVKGMGLKDAIYLLENLGLKVFVSGTGKVIYQSLAQNSSVNKGELIKLQLN